MENLEQASLSTSEIIANRQSIDFSFNSGTNGARVTIKEPIVADPQIAFELFFNQLSTPVTPGWYFDLTIELWMDVDQDRLPDIIVGKVEIFKLNPVKFDQQRLFFNLPFTDPSYQVGDKIQVYFKLTGVDSDSRAFTILPKNKNGDYFTVTAQNNVPGVDEPCSFKG